MNAYLDLIQSGESLDQEQMIDAMTRIMNGEVEDGALAAFLLGLAQRGETVDELTGAAKVLREKAETVKAPYGALDCCGTGGDKSGTYNISTAVALITAACGVPIAKHGNRAATSKSGAADVLESLGVNLDIPLEAAEEALKTLQFAFLMAPNHHKAMKHVIPVRKQLGTRTIFNLLGPLANPAGTRHQLIGVYDRKWLRPMAETLKNLGTKSAWVVHGADGLDEITTTDKTYVTILDEDGKIEDKELTPADFGLEPDKPECLIGGSSEQNAAALRALLEGRPGAYRNIALANSAAALVIHRSAKTLEEGMKKAEEAIDSGLAMQTLRDYISFTRDYIR